tara:strand:- start:1408 stop:2262 length:855 start_codon:yes stop_codon:yes gene_type:complete
MSKHKKRFSFEFFPPQTEAGREKLVVTRNELNKLGPKFFSVTYGAGGSTRDTTSEVVSAINADGIDVAPHLSFGNDGKELILESLQRYINQGINRIVALRGDIPSGVGGPGHLVYANELVEFIRYHTDDHFNIEVAAYPEVHPQSSNYDRDIGFLKQKLDAGANSAITQYFYNVDAYFYFLDQCQSAGIDKPIFAGIMPITNYQNLSRFSRNCGAEIPRWICQRLDSFGNDQDSIYQFGIEVISQLCETLLANGAPGIHFYTMNQLEPVRTIWNNLDLSDQVLL